MNQNSYHRIADDLEAGWLEQWAATGIQEIETYLARHADFLSFLGDDSQ